MVSGILRIIIATAALVGLLGLGASIPLWVACTAGFCVGTTIGYGISQIVQARESN